MNVSKRISVRIALMNTRPVRHDHFGSANMINKNDF